MDLATHNNLSCCKSISATQETICETCLGTGPDSASVLCPVNFIERIGITTTTGTTGSIVVITAPNGIIIDTERINNSIDKINSQLPTGSFKGYISSIFNNIGSSLSKNAEQAFGSILISIILTAYILYVILCIALMGSKIIDVAVGLSLILIGLVIAMITLLICIIEAYKFVTTIENSFGSDIDSLVDNISCAVLSGICCYTGGQCCCPNGSQTPCKNPGFPP